MRDGALRPHPIRRWGREDADTADTAARGGVVVLAVDVAEVVVVVEVVVVGVLVVGVVVDEAADAADGEGDGLALVQGEPEFLAEGGPVGGEAEAGGGLGGGGRGGGGGGVVGVGRVLGVGRDADDGLGAAEVAAAVVEAGDVGCGWRGGG